MITGERLLAIGTTEQALKALCEEVDWVVEEVVYSESEKNGFKAEIVLRYEPPSQHGGVI